MPGWVDLAVGMVATFKALVTISSAFTDMKPYFNPRQGKAPDLDERSDAPAKGIMGAGRAAAKPASYRVWRVMAALAFIGLLVIGFAGYIGYLGGPIFVPVPATAKPPAARRDLAIVLLSGDMGFRVGMGPAIARRLTADGITVIGVNSLTYFRERRSPREATALITDAIHQARAIPRVRHIVLVGQSFGADMLQTGLAGLPEALRSDVVLVALIVPGNTVIFQASPTELLDFATPDTAALPTARRLTWAPVLCIYGVEETNSLCPDLTMPNVRRLPLPGGHPLRRDTDRVHAALADAIRRVSGR